MTGAQINLTFQEGNDYGEDYQDLALTNLPILTVKVVPVLGTNELNLEPTLDNLKDLLTRCMEKVLEVNKNIVKVENIMFPGKQFNL